MQNPFIALGVANDASAEQVRAAYHARVKRCHPDCIQDLAAQLVAKTEMVQLNLAYKEALRQATQRRERNIVMPDAKHVAKKLYAQGQLDGALRTLNKSLDRDAEWFALQGSILLKKGDAEAAHAAFRMAVRLKPENTHYRELALSAGVRMRKQKTLRGRVGIWAKDVVNRML
jgi:Uncharacterized protein conserved in bacteria